MLSGLLPPIADDMGVTIPQAGLLISAFAVGMVVGAPLLLAVATLRLPRRTTLVSLIAVFGLGQIAGALAPTYAVLFASRIVSALACAGFWAVGAAVAIAMVPVTARARALAVMIGGLSIANVLGVPAGAFLGEHLGWRSAFWAVGAASAIALVGVVTLIPRIPLPDEKPQLRREVSIYRDAQVWLTVALVMLAAGGVFCTFSYLSPLLTDVAGLDNGWVPSVLALFGVRGADRYDGRRAGRRRAPLRGAPLRHRGLDHRPRGARAPGAVRDRGRGSLLLLGVTCFFTAPALNTQLLRPRRGRPHPGRCHHHGRLQPRQHQQPLGRRHGHRRGSRLPGDGLGGRCHDADGPGGGRGLAAPPAPYPGLPRGGVHEQEGRKGRQDQQSST